MANQTQAINSDRPGTFQEKTMPAEAGWRAAPGWSRASAWARPVRRPSAVSDQHVKASSREAIDWTISDKRYWPGDSFGDHLGFALRHENLDPLVRY